MSSKKIICIIVLFGLQLLILPFLSFAVISRLSLLSSLFLIFVCTFDMLKKITALNISMLGFGALSFFDIYNFTQIFEDKIFYGELLIDENHRYSACCIYLGFIVFLLTYLFTKKKKINASSLKQISRKVFFYFFLPLTIVATFIFVSLQGIYGNYNIYLVIFSFLPKSAVVLCLYMFLKTKKLYYLFLIPFFILSFTEQSRRVFITLGFMIIPIIMSFTIKKFGSIRMKHKGILVLLFAFSFFWMNFLRSGIKSHDNLPISDLMSNTFKYAKSLSAIDIYENTDFIIRNFPDRFPYYYGSTYMFTIYQFIPTYFWPNKPAAFSSMFGYLRKTGRTDFTRRNWAIYANAHSDTPGLFGEAYANFGFAGIFIIPFLLGYWVRRFDSVILFADLWKNIELLPAISFYSSFFLIHRGDFVSSVFYSILFYLWLTLLVKLLTQRISIR